MFEHILVPTDCTAESRTALDIAVKMQSLERAAHRSQRITLLHVIEAIADDQAQEFQRFYTSLTKRAEKKMQELSQGYGHREVHIDPRIVLGNRVAEILRFAQEQSVDLILLNSHRIDLDHPAEGWGTISYKVSILAHCPVMLVK